MRRPVIKGEISRRRGAARKKNITRNLSTRIPPLATAPTTRRKTETTIGAANDKFLPYFSKNEKICAAETLETYLDKTKNSRDNVKNLFISFKRPFKPVSTQTLSRWVKNSLKTSGIDTSIFSAHFTRHASTSAAKRQGIDIDTLRKTAGWTKASRTFARFYDLQLSVDDRAFANAVLKS
ncbi:hypothetical protein QAD02_016061 [Eretmocerus hayati]|uniref:Uncharacterized protein n=1 Tax=Eretmocerus hayati TaxID=131215 RepID=A0ACC2P9I4_9HYME|nr:hypothetical protein QAD02_016061 [Eretmocerus hayati]